LSEIGKDGLKLDRRQRLTYNLQLRTEN